MPVKYIGSTAPDSVLNGVSHWPSLTEPNVPWRPIAVFRDAMLLPPESTATVDSTCQNTLIPPESLSPPLNPRFDEFCVTRFRDPTFTPVGCKPQLPAGSLPPAPPSVPPHRSPST